MKKRLLSMILIVLLVTAMAISLAACGEEKDPAGLACTVILADKDSTVVATYTIVTESQYLADALTEIAAEANNKVSFDITSGYINSYSYNSTVYGDAANSDYVMTFCSLTDIAYANSAWGTITINSVDYSSCAKGIAETPIVKDATYIIAIQHLSF